jgi:hypothetical protein
MMTSKAEATGRVVRRPMRTAATIIVVTEMTATEEVTAAETAATTEMMEIAEATEIQPALIVGMTATPIADRTVIPVTGMTMGRIEGETDHRPG